MFGTKLEKGKTAIMENEFLRDCEPWYLALTDAEIGRLKTLNGPIGDQSPWIQQAMRRMPAEDRIYFTGLDWVQDHGSVLNMLSYRLRSTWQRPRISAWKITPEKIEATVTLSVPKFDQISLNVSFVVNDSIPGGNYKLISAEFANGIWICSYNGPFNHNEGPQ